MVKMVLQYDGGRALWRVVAGGAILTLIPVLALAGVVAGIFIAGDLSSLGCVVLGALVGVVSPVVAERLWRREWWRSLVAQRLWSFERPFAGQLDVAFAVRERDGERALKALRRAHLYPDQPRSLPALRPEAPDLTQELRVARPEAHTPPDEDGLAFRARASAVLDEAGIEHLQHSSGTSLGPGSVL